LSLIDLAAEMECCARTCNIKELFPSGEEIDPSRRVQFTLPLMELLHDGINVKISLKKNKQKFNLALIRCQGRSSPSMGLQETCTLNMGMNFD
jgi:hypothetical protein